MYKTEGYLQRTREINKARVRNRTRQVSTQRACLYPPDYWALLLFSTQPEPHNRFITRIHHPELRLS
jgi:hypothetical protein